MPGGEKQDLQATKLLVVEGAIWATTILIAWWWVLSVTGQGLRSAIVFTSMLSMIAGVRAFLGHGRATVTATGLFSLSTAMFIGYSGVVLAGRSVVAAEWRYVALAAAAGLTAQVVTTALAWSGNRGKSRKRGWLTRKDANWVASAGSVFLLLSVVVDILAPELGGWTAPSAFTSICLLAAGLTWREDARLISWSTALVVVALLLYAEVIHSGTGQLRIVALACAVAIIYTARFQKRRLKIAIVALIPVALVWLANNRLALEESLHAGGSAGNTGLESMFAPLNVFSLLLQAHHEQGFVPLYGFNLLSVPALVIPKSIWPEQPWALGYELVRFYAPERYGDGIFSTVASSTGEGFYNFGWWGLPIVIVVVACALRLLDGQLSQRLAINRPTILGLLGVVLLAMLAGSVADYTWSGVHTYAARTLLRLPIFLVVVAAAWIHQRLGAEARHRPGQPL